MARLSPYIFAEIPDPMPAGTHRYVPACSMCSDTMECTHCDPDAPDPDCPHCSGTGECPECSEDST